MFGVKFNYNQLGITVVPVLIITIDTIVYNPCYLLVQIRSYLSPLGRSKRGQHGYSGSLDGKMWFDQQ